MDDATWKELLSEFIEELPILGCRGFDDVEDKRCWRRQRRGGELRAAVRYLQRVKT
jgi:hypothetical protein